MTATLDTLTAALLGLAFAAAFAGMVTMTADAARSTAGASTASTDGTGILFATVEF